MPDEASFVRSPYSAALLALRARLVASLGWDASRVLITLLEPDDVQRLHGDSDVLIRPQGEAPNRGMLEAAGRYNDYRTRRLQVVVRSRCQLDLPSEDIARLTDDAFGHLQLEDRVAEALQVFLLTDADSNAIALPARLLDLGHARKMRDDPNWVWSDWQVELDYERDYTDFEP